MTPSGKFEWHDILLLVPLAGILLGAIMLIGAAFQQPLLEPKEQAAVAAVPEVTEASRPVGAVMVVHCRKVVGLGFIGADGSFHDTPLEGMTPAIVQDLLSHVDAEHTYGYVIPCATDGTPL